MTPEEQARQNIDAHLAEVGWVVQDRDALNLYAANGVAVREFPLTAGHGTADYLLFVDQKAVGVVEAKPEGFTLAGVEVQSGKYSEGLPVDLTPPRRPLPFLYESTGVETQFTNLLDPESRSRPVFRFHTPPTFREWLGLSGDGVSSSGAQSIRDDDTRYLVAHNLRQRLQSMPDLSTQGLWPVQARAIRNLEASLAMNKPRAVVQMATGSGKTFMACNLIYRLIKYAGAKRVLFLVDRSNLGRQTYREFQGFTTPDEQRKFTELYNVQPLQSGRIDPVSKVCISTIQRVYSILSGEELEPEQEELSGFDAASLRREPPPIEYNPAVPIETFDVIIIDECHRSIYNLWRQVLEYFDAFLIGLTATPSKQTFGFFNQNLVMEYDHKQAVADGVNVDFDIYHIRTKITKQGSTVKAGHHVDRRNRLTRKIRWEQLEEDLAYAPGQLDKDVVAEDQIRTVVQTFRDKVCTEIFAGREHVPKTIIFAKDDSHADDIVRIVREEFGKGNDFCQKITYRTTGDTPEKLINDFRVSFNPRIVVTVDMIATGTDIKSVEVVFFMRSVNSRNYFEQMKGRGVRTISPTEFNAVTPDALTKDRFVIVDAVGVTEARLSDSYSLERRRAVPFDKLLERISMGDRTPDTLSSLASRLSRLNHRLTEQDQRTIEGAANGVELETLIGGLVRATDPDAAFEEAQRATGLDDPPKPAVAQAQKELMEAAARPFASNPGLRETLINIHRFYEQTIDTVSKDSVIDAGYTDEQAKEVVQSFQEYIEENRDEITALQVLYQRPYQQRLRYDDIRELAENLRTPPRSWTNDRLWTAYQRLEESKVRGSGQRRLADIVSLVRYAIGDAEELAPFAEGVHERFQGWLAMQETAGRAFTDEQRRWLEDIRDHIAGSVSMAMEDFQLPPFSQQGGLGKAHQLFGEELAGLLDDLNKTLVT